jgi:hypothetical protein
MLIMSVTADIKRRVLVTIPADVGEWLEAQARFNGGTMSGEVTRALRSLMKQERAGATIDP